MPPSSPPPLPPHLVPRPALDARLATAATPLLTIVAGPGWGKTTALAVWSQARQTAWVRLGPSAVTTTGVLWALTAALRSARPDLPAAQAQALDGLDAGGGPDETAIEVLAAELAGVLGEALAAPAALVLDEADHLEAGTSGARLVDALLRQLPDGLQVATASHRSPGLDLDALRARAALTQVGTDELRLDVDGAEALVARLLGDGADGLGPAVHRLTHGWPEAVRLVGLSLIAVPPDRRPAELESSGRGLVAVTTFVRTEIIRPLDPALLDVLRWGVAAGTLTPALCAQLCAPPDALSHLAARGLVHATAEGDQVLVSPLATTALRDHDGGPVGTDVHRAVVDALGALDDPVQAMEVALASGDDDLVADTLLHHVSYLTRTPKVDLIARAGAAIAVDRRTPELEGVIANAHMMRNEWTAALDCLHRASAGLEQLPTAVAWRLGHMLYLRWQIPDAVAAFDAAAPIDPDDWEAGVLRNEEAWVRRLVGQHDRALACAEEALDIGTRTQNPYVLCGAHTALHVLCGAAGDRVGAERHYLDAREYARRYGAALMEVRLRSNHVSSLVEEGRYDEAIAEAEEILPVADRAGHIASRLLVMTNLADAQRHRGRLDVAERLALEAIEIGRGGGIGLTIYPTVVLADVHRDRGDVEQACGLYAEVAQRSRASGDVQALVLALSGAARVTADPAAAHGYANEALVAAAGGARLPARLARAWTALRLGEEGQARGDARSVLVDARRSGSAHVQAEALELLGATAGDPIERDEHLRAAIAIWQRIGAGLDVLRAQQGRARLAGDTAEAEAARAARAAASVSDRVVAVAGLDQAVATLVTAAGGAPPERGVRVFTLGGFALHRDGVPVPTSAWGSRKPRELLQILVGRRGQRVPRGVLVEALWPGEDPVQVGNRLSVALSTLRGVLDPDKVHAPEHFVLADHAAVWLDLQHLEVDLEAFHQTIARGRAAVAARDAQADDVLEEAVAIYGGEFMADLPYEDWTTAAREEARAAFLEALRLLTTRATDRGDVDAAVRASLRLLAEDPYDESAHRQLIEVCATAGRHGEAQRHYRHYVSQMRRLDIPPMPFPKVTGLRGIA